jgi:O-antigen ligase
MSRFKTALPRPGSLAPPPRPPVPSYPPAAHSQPAPPLARLIPIAPSNPLHSLGFFFTAAYLAVLYGALSELLDIVSHIYLPVAYLFGVPALLAGAFAGRFQTIFRTRVGVYMTLLCGCFIASLPFSVVHSASLLLLKSTLLTQYSTFFLIAMLASTVRRVRWLMYTIAASCFLDLVAALRFGVTTRGRFAIMAGSLANPNDLALHLLIGLPFCLLILFDKRTFKLLKLVSAAAVLDMVHITLRTGSRMGIICLLLIGGFAVMKASFSQRIALALLTFSVAAALPVLAPETWARFVPMFNPNASRQSSLAMEAKGSTESRLDLLERSLEITFKHPLLGVGIGEFADAEAMLASSEGVRAHWQVTHNAYTQVSSECGIPALLCFAGVIFGSLRLSLRLYDQTKRNPNFQPIAQMALNLALATACLAVGMLFDSLAYTYYVPVVAGLSVALWNASQDELRVPGR